MKNKIILTILLSIIISGCKKYEEGPFLSLRSKNHRIEGNWKVKSLIIDNQEQVNYYHKGTYYTVHCVSGSKLYMYDYFALKSYLWEIKDGGSASLEIKTVEKDIDFNKSSKNCTETYFPEIESNQKQSRTWEFDKKKENLILISPTGFRDSYEILQLKEKEVKLKRIDIDGAKTTTLIFTLEKN